MQYSLFLLLAFGLLLSQVFAQELEEGVAVLTDANFDEYVTSNEFVLVEFYAPWCGHCKSLAPEYAKAATQLANSNSEVKLAKVDATEHKEVGGRFGVKGFPTLKFFRSGSASEYQGGRTADEIVSWVSKKTGPIAQPVSTEEALEHMKEANDVFIIGCFSDESSDAAKLFLDVAAANDAYAFAITSSTDVTNSIGVSGDQVVVIKHFDDLRNEMVMDTSTTAASISEFISGHAAPLVQTFTDETSSKIFKSTIQKHTLFFTVAGSDHHERTVDAFKDAAMDFRGKTMMINVPDNQARVAEYFGLKKEDFPAAVFADMSGGAMKKYPMNFDLTTDNIKDFLTKALRGDLTPTLKSEEPSDEDTSGPVTIVKGKSFADIVINNNNDVLVEFYAPWCGHCKSLAPIYDELGEKYQSNKNIVIAKMDATANEIDIPGVDVKGFPTLIFFKGNDKKHPVKYEGGRTLNEFVEFLESNTFNEVGGAADDEDDKKDEL